LRDLDTNETVLYCSRWVDHKADKYKDFEILKGGQGAATDTQSMFYFNKVRKMYTTTNNDTACRVVSGEQPTAYFDVFELLGEPAYDGIVNCNVTTAVNGKLQVKELTKCHQWKVKVGPEQVYSQFLVTVAQNYPVVLYRLRSAIEFTKFTEKVDTNAFVLPSSCK